MLRERLSHFGRITRWGWFVIYEVVWVALYTNIDIIVSEYGSQSQQALWHRLTHPHWGWKSWIIGALVIVILFLVDGSYRNHRELQRQIEKLRDDLQLVGGPILHVGYIRGNYLAVENAGGGALRILLF